MAVRHGILLKICVSCNQLWQWSNGITDYGSHKWRGGGGCCNQLWQWEEGCCKQMLGVWSNCSLKALNSCSSKDAS